MFKLFIEHCYRTNTKDTMTLYDQTIKEFKDMDSLKEFLKDRYNNKLKPNINNTLYMDNIKTKETVKMGMSFSYWDIPYKETKNILNTDIITISKIEYSTITDKEFKEIFKRDSNGN